jgi:hypothetical protein
MKKVLLSLAFAIGMVTFMSAQNAVDGPNISIDKEVHDYGEVPFGGDGTCEFKVTNTGTGDLILSKCKGSCGCTVPKCDPNPIGQNQSSVITVKYDTKRPGPINKSVTINSNATNEPVKVVRIKGNVGADPNAAPAGSAPEKAQPGVPAGGGH